ncbi:hypothetical protein FO521_32605 [Bacillus pseudomycoides]|uniref:hypothetical protein n=1 Tax=Bacillus pseudomycoides TaxID=64104 RepID=UPI00284B2500|nr:hypothetical protein [Bacillus pseudomycoides]MDR4191301.1 hypothetical protein [Bacillus pseudomycoides]
MLKKLAIGTLAIGILLPGNLAHATSPQQVHNPLEIKPLVQTSLLSEQYSYSFSSLSDPRQFGHIYVNNAGHITFNVDQKTVDGKRITYAFLKMEPDGSSTIFGSGTFKGTGSFTFTTNKPAHVGNYMLYVINVYAIRSSDSSGTITFTTP